MEGRGGDGKDWEDGKVDLLYEHYNLFAGIPKRLLSFFNFASDNFNNLLV